MAYSAEISRSNPSAFIFLIDQSGSTADLIAPSNPQLLNRPMTIDGKTYTHSADGPTIAQKVADAINKLLQNLVLKCAKSEGVRDYYHVSVIGYGNQIGPAFGGVLAGRELVPISEIADNPLNVETRTKKIDDGAGGLVDQTVRFPIWFNPVANGGTPMCQALSECSRIMSGWISQYPDGFPPVVIHITDGESTDGNPLLAMNELTSLSTSDGNLLLFNLHITANPNAQSTSFPDSPDALPDEYARTLFGGASPLTSFMRKVAENDYQIKTTDGARGFVLNGDVTLIVTALDIGTRPSNLR